MSTMKHHHNSMEADPLGLGACSEKNLVWKSYNSSCNSLMDMETAQLGQKRSRKGTEKIGKGINNGCAVGGGESSEHEMHIWTERERRKKMRNMFSSLHALLPQLPPKADKSTIVNEAVKYIKTLQQTLQSLQKQKLEKLQGSTNLVDNNEPSVITSSQIEAFESREAYLAVQGSSKNFLSSTSMPSPFSVVPLSPACFQTWFSPNVVMNMCGDDAQISVCSVRKPGLLTTFFYILEKHNLEVVSAHICSDQYRSIYMIHAHAGGASDSNQYPEALSVEDTFKLAAGEMNLWLLSC